MAGDKTYITDGQGKLHRATRVHAVTPTDIVWSSNPNDYTVQVKIGGKWHRAVLTMDAGAAQFFDNVNIDKGLVVGTDGKTHTALIVKPESTVTLSDIKTDTHGTIAGTTTGETAVSTYSENWSDVKWQDNVNVYKVLVTGSDGKVHTALLTTSAGGGGVQVIVLGPSPLSLPDAVAHSLSYVKAFGGTEHRNIPSGYQQRQFVYMMAGSYIKIEDLLISAGYRVEFEFQTLTLASPLRNFIGGRANGVSAGGGFRLSKLASGGSTLNRVVLYGFESGTEYYDPITQFQPNTRYKYTYTNGVCTLETGGSVISTRTFTVTDTTSTKWGINSYVSGNDYWQTDTGDIYVYSVKVWNDQNELVMDLVPVIQQGTVPVVGFYDTVTGDFRTTVAGTFAAGPEVVPTPDAPMDIVCNNGVLKHSANMANVNAQTILLGYYISSSGIVTADANNWIYQDYIPVSPNTTYTLTMSSPVYFVSISEYSTADDGGFIRRNAGSTGTNTSLTITTDANTRFIRFGTNIDRTEITLEEVLAINWQLNKGNSMPFTPYSPTGVYADGTVETIEDTIGNTATAEMLLKVGTYTDEQEVISGVVTRKVGIKVLDGTEDGWAKTNNSFSNTALFSDKKVEKSIIFCSHFQYDTGSTSTIPDTCVGCASTSTNTYFRYNAKTTDTQWKQWLADQYAAGTPVIVIYPLATETTESVTGQTLQVQAGNNTLEITQASLAGLELEAEYTKVA